MLVFLVSFQFPVICKYSVYLSSVFFATYSANSFSVTTWVWSLYVRCGTLQTGNIGGLCGLANT
jgi:hypothetical protein